ncbi:PQQ-dependent dehydrogenase, methanol/ethanol family [Phenylobacterium montanum]|uniref:PQQ-dependent dehydrogenase, methanol/ethanol family n=1 Tax=Phenylobacterium montanum TaxID=2823693 RepID=A0A975G0U3_9CAUL|nr:PQQ-dependent dehydrogenase, methanol/ethanol family [Caulobacter sp. S6]QUD88477.1 PQQ-dependent dehydrogenase, methanol/ethanol family [Caulobacter sp. S6]
MRGYGAALAAVLAASMALAGCNMGHGPAAVDAQRLTEADKDPGNWMSHGRTYSEQRFSPLDKVNASNVKDLGLAWSYELSTNRGVETTPIVVDGVMYVTSSWSLVYALDAKTGKELWKYDPKVPREVGHNACCDVVNRGVAVWKGRVYVATLDGRLVALDAKTGQPAWSVVTVDQTKPYTITMAPRIIKGKVMVGNSGSEYGVRGYVSAYDADDGKLIWRFYTVPGDPKKPFENKAMEAAAKTWSGDWWTMGGGGSPWDSMSYDPETNLLFFGTGNGLPWDEKARSPKGGDNLYLASIIAVDADTGEYRWHVQTTPGDSWDFDSTQTLTLADLTIDGQPRKVVMQASKNGFFYVIDRASGKLISAKNYVPTTWASGVDLATGKPIEIGDDHYKAAPTVMLPSSFGGHNWHPMAFSPKTGLVYIPAQEVPGAFGTDDKFAYRPGEWNTATNTDLNTLPADPKARAAMRNSLKGYLLAWDPVKQKEAWRVAHVGPWNGGTLATGGGLVFQGTADGHFNAYDAANGNPLWSADTYTATLAGPMTYTVDGEQYVAVGAGFGSIFYLAAGFAVPKVGTPENGKILVYKLGGAAKLQKPDLERIEMPKPPAMTASAQVVTQGHSLFNRNCLVCHGYNAISGGVIPDLRYSPLIANAADFKDVVLGGSRKSNGMVSFAKQLSEADAEAVRAYVISEANAGYAEAHQGGK